MCYIQHILGTGSTLHLWLNLVNPNTSALAKMVRFHRFSVNPFSFKTKTICVWTSEYVRSTQSCPVYRGFNFDVRLNQFFGIFWFELTRIYFMILQYMMNNTREIDTHHLISITRAACQSPRLFSFLGIIPN